MIAITRPVKRETAASTRRSPLIVELYPRHLVLREKGRSARLTGVSVDYRAIYDLGWKMLAREKAAEKRGRK